MRSVVSPGLLRAPFRDDEAVGLVFKTPPFGFVFSPRGHSFQHVKLLIMGPAFSFHYVERINSYY